VYNYEALERNYIAFFCDFHFFVPVLVYEYMQSKEQLINSWILFSYRFNYSGCNFFKRTIFFANETSR